MTDAIVNPNDKRDRIYLFVPTLAAAASDGRRLVRAPNFNIARNFVARTMFTGALASQDDLIACTVAGVPVEDIPANEPAAAA